MSTTTQSANQASSCKDDTDNLGYWTAAGQTVTIRPPGMIAHRSEELVVLHAVELESVPCRRDLLVALSARHDTRSVLGQMYLCVAAVVPAEALRFSHRQLRWAAYTGRISVLAYSMSMRACTLRVNLFHPIRHAEHLFFFLAAKIPISMLV